MKRNIRDRTPSIAQPKINASLELRNFGASPTAVSDLLGVEPTRVGVAGEPYRTVKGTPTEQILRETFWSLWSTASTDAPLEQHLENILGQIELMSDRFTKLPAATTRTIRCSIIPEGPLPLFRLNSDLLHRLSRLRLDVVLDVVSVG